LMFFHGWSFPDCRACRGRHPRADTIPGEALGPLV
jgi:hypothetical protein